jgi:hypothetical protein
MAASAVVLLQLAASAGAPSGAQVHPGSVQKSTMISGYQISAKALAVLRATVVVPAATCTSSGLAFEIGVALTGSYGSTFSFSSYSQGVVDVLCAKGKPHFVSSVIADNEQTKASLTAEPGQDIRITIKQNRNGAFVSLTDEATDKSIRDETPSSLGAFESSLAQFGSQPLDVDGVQSPAPRFKTSAFKDVTANGNLLGTWDPVAYELVYRGKVSVRPTSIGSEQDFSLVFKSN